MSYWSGYGVEEEEKKWGLWMFLGLIEKKK